MESGDAKLRICVQFIDELVKTVFVKSTGTGRRLLENLDRWKIGTARPTAATVRSAVEYLWSELPTAATSESRIKFMDLIKKWFPELGPEVDQETLAAHLADLVNTGRRERRQARLKERAERKQRVTRAAHPAKSTVDPQFNETGRTVTNARAIVDADIPSDPVVVAVDQLFNEAGLSVTRGRAIIDTDLSVDLTPLYTYIASLQQSATIPSYFPGVPDIRLDELYVELSASESQRGTLLDDPNTQTWKDADKAQPDHLGIWRIAAAARRIPLATLLSRTEVMPAVVFGDPGSGKSCLTRFTLHELGRGLIDPKHFLGVRALPFRIPLREFVKDGRADGYSILRYLIRHQLKVPDHLLKDWVTLLGHFFSNVKPSRLLLLIDGIDEVTPDTLEYAQIRQQFENATSIARMAFTSRRAGFQPPVQVHGSFELIELSEVSIHAMIRNWFRAVKERSPDFAQSFISWIFSDPRRQDMAGNPCLLGLLCFLNQDRKDQKFLQANTRTGLYRLVVEKFLQACDSIPHEERDDVESTLSAFALDRYRVEGDQKAPLALFSRDEVRHFLVNSKRHRRSGHSPIPLDRLMKAWREMRMVSQWDLANWHHFLHLTFQEYFAARALGDLPESEVAALMERHRFNPYWREVWRFYAGVCRSNFRGDTRRFGALIQSFLSPEDLYGETGFLAAPLCAEFELRDTTAQLGFDLRERLYDNVRQRHQRAMALIEGTKSNYDSSSYLKMQEARTNNDPELVGRIRVMVELDPEHFFSVVRSLIDAGLDTVAGRRGRIASRKKPDRSETLLAVLILSCIYHPSALEYQAQLIRSEAAKLLLKPSDPPVGPRTATGRNESLFKTIRDVIPSTKGWLHRHRLVNYLAYTRSPEAAAVILQIARTPIPAAKPADMLTFQVQCLEAICHLQDPVAVELARELWAEPKFLGNLVERACQSLCQLKVTEAAALLEEWLVEERVDPKRIAFEQLISALKEWRERDVPDVVEAMLRAEGAGVEMRVKLWELVIARTGAVGQHRLVEKFRAALAKRQLTKEQWRELAALSQLVARERLDLFQNLEAMAERVPNRFPTERQNIWGALIELGAAWAQVPFYREWLIDVGVPKLETELRKAAKNQVDDPTNWMDPLSQCPRKVLDCLATKLRPLAAVLNDNLLADLMHCFSSHPSLLPKDLLERALNSDNTELKRVGWEALLELDPGRLVSLRSTDELIEKLLRETSTSTGVLFFADRMYSPSIPGFLPYSTTLPVTG